MKHKILHILLLLALLPLSVWAQSEGYDPVNPGDPTTPTPKYLVSLKADPANGGHFSTGDDYYKAGTTIRIATYGDHGYTLSHWTIDGEVVSTEEYIDFTVPEKNTEIVAHFIYDPSNPGDPESTIKIDESEWKLLLVLNEALNKMGKKDVWDVSQGMAAAANLKGVTLENGYITALDLSNQELKGELPLAALALPHLKSLNLSHNQLSGNLGLIGKAISSLVSLNVSYNAFTDVMPMLPATIKNLDISHQTIDRTIVLDASNYNVTALLAQMPTILAYDHQNQTFNTTNLACLLTTSEGPDWYDKWAVMLKLSNGNLTMPYVTTPSEYKGQSGDILHLVKLNNDWANSMDGSNLKVKYIFPLGDANFKPGVDATDVQATVLYAFGEYNNLPFNLTAADTYTDGQINVQDVICTVNIVLGEAASQARSYQKDGFMSYQQNVLKTVQQNALETAQQNDDAKAHIYMQDGKVILSTETPVAALCIKASGKITWSLNQPGMEQAIQDANLVGYSLSRATLPVGETVIGTYMGDANIWDVNLSDSNAEAIPATITRGTSTGIKGISTVDHAEMDDNGQQPETFNLQGIKTSQMQKGINIVKKNGKIHKVIKQ